ncbi:MAG: hypothetical protein R3D90_13710 [Paracoccaceae bacterium]
MAEATYSAKAQPFLDAIAAGVFSQQEVRDWLVQGTPKTADFTGSRSLHKEQERLRPETKQPFWANLWCGKDVACTCRIPGSRSLETDALFILESPTQRRLALHVEFKHPRESLQPGQAEGYPLRAACWADKARCPRRVLPHDEWLTVIFCDATDLSLPSMKAFDRRIAHQDARTVIPSYPHQRGATHV